MEKRKSVINLTLIALNFYAIILEGVRHEIVTTIKYKCEDEMLSCN